MHAWVGWLLFEVGKDHLGGILQGGYGQDPVRQSFEKRAAVGLAGGIDQDENDFSGDVGIIERTNFLIPGSRSRLVVHVGVQDEVALPDGGQLLVRLLDGTDQVASAELPLM